MSPQRLVLPFVLLLAVVLALAFWYFLRGDDEVVFEGAATGDRRDEVPILEPRRRVDEAPEPATGTEDGNGDGARGAGRIAGRIDCPEGFDPAEVLVILEKAWQEEDDDPDFRLETRPDAEGRFVFDGLVPDRDHVVTLEAPGRLVRPARSASALSFDPGRSEALVAPIFDVRPVLACAPRLLDPSGFEVTPTGGRAIVVDRRQFLRAGLETVADARLHGLAEEDLELAAAGVGVYCVPKERMALPTVALEAELVPFDYEPQRTTLGLVEIRPGSAIPRPTLTLVPGEGTRPVVIDLRYFSGGIPVGAEELLIRRHGGWSVEEVYRLSGFDLLDLPAARFRLRPGLGALTTRDGRVSREFTVPEGEGECRIEIAIPRGGDITIELPPEGAPWRLAVPVQSASLAAPEPVETSSFSFRDLGPGRWSFGAVDRRGRPYEGSVELKPGQDFRWRASP